MLSKVYLPGEHKVYNIEVHDAHNYFVSELGVLVHNTGPVCPTMLDNFNLNEDYLFKLGQDLSKVDFNTLENIMGQTGWQKNIRPKFNVPERKSTYYKILPNNSRVYMTLNNSGSLHFTSNAGQLGNFYVKIHINSGMPILRATNARNFKTNFDTGKSFIRGYETQLTGYRNNTVRFGQFFE